MSFLSSRGQKARNSGSRRGLDHKFSPLRRRAICNRTSHHTRSRLGARAGDVHHYVTGNAPLSAAVTPNARLGGVFTTIVLVESFVPVALPPTMAVAFLSAQYLAKERGYRHSDGMVVLQTRRCPYQSNAPRPNARLRYKSHSATQSTSARSTPSEPKFGTPLGPKLARLPLKAQIQPT